MSNLNTDATRYVIAGMGVYFGTYVAPTFQQCPIDRPPLVRDVAEAWSTTSIEEAKNAVMIFRAAGFHCAAVYDDGTGFGTASAAITGGL